MTRPPAHGEGGSALLMVLIVVAVVGALAAVTFDRLRLATMLAINSSAVAQARSLAMAAEPVALARIDDLVAASPTRTTLAGDWQGRPLAIPTPIGTASIVVRDGGNCFNLNSLAVQLAAGRLASRPAGIDQFVRLLAGLGIDIGLARHVAEAAADWIDSDGIANPAGAEDADYARAAPGQRTGNTLFAEASELRAVAGMTPALYARLRPFLCALPVTDLSPLNINTLTAEQALLLAMLFPTPLSEPQARRILAQRPAAGWASVADFWNSPALRDVQPAGEALRQPQARTGWFTLDLGIGVADTELRESVLVDARRSPARIASRRWTEDE